MVREGVIKLTLQGGTPHAYATINGSLTLLMTVDTGASAVTLSADSAKKLGLTPDSHDPTVKISTADGKLTDVKVMTLDSIKVGQFTVQNVKCYVLPAKVSGSNLLGGTFLRNFICRMDLSALELHLTQVGSTQEPPKNDRIIDRLEEPTRNFAKTGKLIVPVKAADDWTNFLAVKKGDVLAISATGTWFFGSSPRQEVGPAGKPKLAYLEAKIGETVFRIDEAATITAPADGILSMRMNDTMRTDNSGALTVTIVRKAP
jgi:clan AA aspartic protease (TIGR02281 family)